MESLYLLIPISVAIIFGVCAVFLRMAAQGQFDDLDSPASRILLDDDRTLGRPAEPATGGRDDSTGERAAPAARDGLGDCRGR